MTINRRDFILLTGLTGLPALTSPWHKQPIRYGQPQPDEKKIIPIPESWIELNPEHIHWNLKQIRQKVKVPIMAVIKANAYGHGLVEFGKILDQSGIDALMVCELQEAVTLRESGISCPIYNFGPVIPLNTDILIQHNISQFLHPGDIQDLSRRAEKHQAKINCHIHIDTGMHRMGFPYEKALSTINLASSLKGLSISGVSTTLTEDKDFDKVQLQRLQSIYDKAKSLGIDLGMRHAASSAGIFESDSYYLDMIRPGIVLYGYYPNERTRNESQRLQMGLEAHRAGTDRDRDERANEVEAEDLVPDQGKDRCDPCRVFIRLSCIRIRESSSSHPRETLSNPGYDHRQSYGGEVNLRFTRCPL